MLTAGDRSGLQLRRLAHCPEHAADGESLRQTLYGRLRPYAKFLVVAATFFSFVLASFALQLTCRSPRRRRLRVTLLSQRLSRFLVRILNIHCTVDMNEQQRTDAHASLLLIPNHMSYLDVIVINALFPAVFVTSREIEEAPVLSSVSKAAGCTFIERRHKRDLHRDIDQLSGLLNAGFNVVLFPEGTTSPGERLMDFKQSLLESALRSRCRVVPLCIRYEAIDGRRFDASNRDQVAWYGAMTFFPHLLQLMASRSIDVRLTVLNEVAFRSHRSRKRLAYDAKSQITECYHAP